MALSFSGSIFANETEEAFSFSARPICSSSRAHQGTKLLLIVTGIPRLSKPLVSCPISLRARIPQKRTVSLHKSKLLVAPVANQKCLSKKAEHLPMLKQLVVFSAKEASINCPLALVHSPLLVCRAFTFFVFVIETV